MTTHLDLAELFHRENEQTEWKENVADIDDVVATLTAFANDLQNLGGGYVVCGAKEDKDEAGFPKVTRIGLSANRFKEVENIVLTRCRERVSPPITPLVEELPTDDENKRMLVFIQRATTTAHTFRKANDGAKHYVRVSRSTIEARNGLLLNLLTRKGDIEPWDERPCSGTTINDIDLLALREALLQMNMLSNEHGVEHYLSAEVQLHQFVPPLLVREPLTGILRPRNFTILLFGRQTQRFIRGAISIFSRYPGTDRSDSHAERKEFAGNLLEQARQLIALLDLQVSTIFDKDDSTTPNAVNYPSRALHEALSNALAHRNYELPDPTRITVFADRIEVNSPGSLPLGVSIEALREGRSGPKWRNQALAWFFAKIQLAQAEGQGIPTILRTMRLEGCPPPILEADEAHVCCTLPAHPRHVTAPAMRIADELWTLGDLDRALAQVREVLQIDPKNSRARLLLDNLNAAKSLKKKKRKSRKGRK